MLRKGLLAGGVALLIAAGILFIRRSAANKSNVAPIPAASTVSEITEANLTGRIQARTTVMAGAPLEGVLESYFVDAGQEVYQGQLLGRIRSAQLEEAVQRAQAELDLTQARIVVLGNDELAARLEASRVSANQSRAASEVDRVAKIYEREQKLWGAGATPRRTFEQAEKDYTDAKAELEKAAAAVAKAGSRIEAVAHDLEAARRAVTELTQAIEGAKAGIASGEMHSPADGVVTARRGQAGQPVDLSMKDLVEIATDLTSLQAVATTEPGVLARIRAGQQASVRLPELSADELPGVVRELREMDVIVDFTSSMPIVKLSVTAQVRIKFQAGESLQK
jgi:multidrug resistance efflux pump